MKFMSLVLVCLVSVSAWAQRDSVGVFYRPEKTVVLVTENFHRSQRLLAMMQTLGAENRLLLISSDNSLKIDCGANLEVASCTFRFFPSEAVEIGNKNVEALINLTDLGVAQAADYEMIFESSMADRFILKIEKAQIYLYAHKRHSDKYQP